MDIEFTEKLIIEVRNRPLIYLLSHKDYKNNMKKTQAWREIQEILNEEVPTLKAKWKNLKDTYKKYKQSMSTSSGQAAKKLQNWAWADHMTFIEPSVSLNETESSIVLPNDSNEEHNNTPATNNDPLSEETENRHASGARNTQNGQQIYRRHRRQNMDPTDRMIQYLQNRPRNRNNNDERMGDGIDLLFLGYADAFKKLSKRKQVTVKFNIARILMEAELDDLNRPERSSISSDTQNSFNAPSPDSYGAHTPGNYSVTSPQDYSITNATSPDNYVAPLTPGNYSMISDATINDTQGNTDHYILPHNRNFLATDLTTNNLNTANMSNTNYNSANMNNTNYNSAANYHTCSKLFSEFRD